MAEIVLPEGFLPLVTEGSLASGGESDVRRPHLPENVAIFRPYTSADAAAKPKRYALRTDYPSANIFAPNDKGSYVIKRQITGEARYAITSADANAAAGEIAGTFPNASGLTIGMGCDLGASYKNASSITELFNLAAEVGSDTNMATIGAMLGEAAGKRGMQALAVTNKLRQQIKLTPQQVLDLSNAMWKKKEKGIAGFIQKGIVISDKRILAGGLFDYNGLFAPLKQILIRAAYSNLYRVAGIANGMGGIDKLSPLEQCRQMMRAFTAYDYDKCKSYGFVEIVNKFISELEKGNTITIKSGPIQVADLIDPNKPVGGWLTDIRKSAKNDKKDFRDNLRNDLQKQGIDINAPSPSPNTTNTSTTADSSESVSFLQLLTMAMSGKGDIKGKVGKGGDNNPQDVIVIKALLTSHGYYDFSYNPITIWAELQSAGASSAKLEEAITKFQTDRGAKKPDGRVDPNGTTLGWLNGPKAAPTNTTTNPTDTTNTTTNPTNTTTNPTNTQSNGKQLVINETVLALGTEGVPCGENSLDVRLPHWPGYVSGVSIGVGFDIGASGITAEELYNVMGILGVPKVMIDELAKTVKVTAEPARDLLESLKLREKVRLTQQQAIDIMVVIKQKSSASTRKAFSKSYATTHPAVIEVLNKFAYGAPALVLGYKNGFSGLGPLFDAELAKVTDHKAQCDVCVKMCDAVIGHFGADSVHGKIGNGMKTFIKHVKGQLEQGVEVIIDKKPISMEELLDPKNKTLDIAAMVSHSTYGQGKNHSVDLYNKRGALQKARNEEPARMQAICSKVGCNMPPLNGTALANGNLEKCYQLMTKKDLVAEKVQVELVKLGYFDKAGVAGGMKNADGDFGGNSRKALALFQADYNKTATTPLRTDGQLDAASKDAVLNHGKTPTPNNNSDNNNGNNNTDPVKVTMPALMGDASFGCYH